MNEYLPGSEAVVGIFFTKGDGESYGKKFPDYIRTIKFVEVKDDKNKGEKK